MIFKIGDQFCEKGNLYYKIIGVTYTYGNTSNPYFEVEITRPYGGTPVGYKFGRMNSHLIKFLAKNTARYLSKPKVNHLPKWW